MKSLFLVESPLQYINALEARQFYKLKAEESVVVLFEGISIISFKQILNISKQDHWGKVIIIRKNQHIILRYWSLFLCMRILRKFQAFEWILIGEYRSDIMRHIIHKFNPKRKILLDDGNVTPLIYQKNQRRELIDLTKKRRFLNQFFWLNDNEIFDIEYFSCFPLGEMKPKNTYEALKIRLGSKEQSDEVFFLGNNVAELDIMGEEKYLSALEKVVSFYKGKKVIYFPHRRENDMKLKKIENNYPVEVRRVSAPFEVTLVDSEMLPLEICSFISSALETSARILEGKAQITAFKLPVNSYIESYKNSYLTTFANYEEYSNDDLRVILLDNN